MGSSKGLQPLRSASKTLNALPAAYAGAQIASRRYAGTLANFKIPTVNNEPNVSLKRNPDVQNQSADHAR